MLSAVGSDRQLLDQIRSFRRPSSLRWSRVQYGPAVLQVCRGVLQDPHEAEDAFQATFLVLVRKAPVLRDPEAVGGWLRGVAYRTAVRARCRTAAASSREIGRDFPVRHLPEALAPDQREIIREELERLPALLPASRFALLSGRFDAPGGLRGSRAGRSVRARFGWCAGGGCCENGSIVAASVWPPCYCGLSNPARRGRFHNRSAIRPSGR